MRIQSTLQLLSFLLLLPAFLALGCSDSSSPTVPDGPLVFSGQVLFKGTTSHDFNMPDDGLISITLSDVRVLLFDSAQANLANLVVGFGVGQRNDNDDCILTSNFAISEGQLSVFRLSRDDYCMSVFDPGALPEDAVLSYTLQAELSF